MKSKLVSLALALSASGLLTAQRATAGDGNPGREAYFRYCASCHGIDGRGHGEVARSMRPKPPDLTRLAKDHRGEFPEMLVKNVIDGRRAIAAHGSAAMPVWGQVFSQEPTSESPEAHTRSQVQVLVDYLRSMQN